MWISHRTGNAKPVLWFHIRGIPDRELPDSTSGQPEDTLLQKDRRATKRCSLRDPIHTSSIAARASPYQSGQNEHLQTSRAKLMQENMHDANDRARLSLAFAVAAEDLETSCAVFP
ncbi:hypothetical protein SMMN14_06446 [Sphaerulina musiva]